ncbi:nucleoside triphosphate pyrophosphohydrolase [Neomegalonema sp.]|uniref:nucleoside triphosphate pyrophosphohydrolase n=1 Tax=Neomegalonema sp. TaxID=2039713 RepID=UPI002604EC38|nr:nucleoside triphosphate pyrophosphohydrolase [Neomegalonema sp.]MDD2868528.1 nucleoside triphosphate pyrophosphohydrolase [Neomegalonema sp.]
MTSSSPEAAPSEAARELERLIAIMARLRDPETGCPWDREQDFASIAPYTIEEAYEVADAVARADMPGLKSELGDLLLQVAYHSRMAEEQGHFAFADAARAINEKMISRHPHVFGEAAARSAGEQTALWEAQKAQERAARAQTGTLDDVPLALPALARAEKIQKRAARVGFDWPDPEGAREKMMEEIEEVRAEIAPGASPGAPSAALVDEMGDLLFSAVNWSRMLGVDPEEALRAATRKFEARFRRVEAIAAAQGAGMKGQRIDVLEGWWREAKRAEKA